MSQLQEFRRLLEFVEQLAGDRDTPQPVQQQLKTWMQQWHVIWLATQMQSSESDATTVVFSATTAVNAEDTVERNMGNRSNLSSLPSQQSPDGSSSQPDQAGLYPPEPQQNRSGDFNGALTLRVPDARSLREPLSLARSPKACTTCRG